MRVRPRRGLSNLVVEVLNVPGRLDACVVVVERPVAKASGTDTAILGDDRVHGDPKELHGDTGIRDVVPDKEVVLLEWGDAGCGSTIWGNGKGSLQRDAVPLVRGDAAVLAGPASGNQEDPGSLPVIRPPASCCPIRLVRQGECRPRNAGNGAKKGAVRPVGSHRLAVQTPEVAEGIVREVYVPRRGRAVEGTQAATGRHQVPAANHIVLEDQPIRAADEIPAPPSVGKRIPRHQPTAHPAKE